MGPHTSARYGAVCRRFAVIILVVLLTFSVEGILCGLERNANADVTERVGTGVLLDMVRGIKDFWLPPLGLGSS